MSKDQSEIEVGYTPDDEGHDQEHQREKTPRQKKTTIREKKLRIGLKEREALLNKVIKEREEFKDKYLRNLAEIDNFRKRIKKEKEEYQKFFLADFLIDLLLVFDNLERAIKAKRNEESNEESIISGVEMIHKQFIELLKKYHVKEIEALHMTFDPNIHQALSKEERAGITEPVVIEVYQKGFLYHNKLLRPTLAKVAIPVEAEDIIIEQE